MKRIKYISILLATLLMSVAFSSCVNDLNQNPLDPAVATSDVTFSNTALPYTQYLAKVYAGFSVGAIKGAEDGGTDNVNLDIIGYDAGSQAGYLRPLWNLQELPTEEAMCCWNDATIQDFHKFSWTATDVFINGFYSRLYYQITIATAFLQETTADKLAARGCSASLTDSIAVYRAEARFLRALAYYNVLDLFRNGPMVTDDSKLGTTDLPPYATSQQLFSYVESELTDCQNSMLTPTVGNSAAYGHANKAAAWALLARLYLNADAFLGTSNTAKYYTSCIDNCKKVISAGYELQTKYKDIYVTDNYNSKEIIFPIVFDGTNLTSWGGMMFLECSAVNGDIQSLTGAPGAWGGNRATPTFLSKFTSDEANYTKDERYAMLYQGFNHPSIDDNTLFTQGVPVLKYSNKNMAGTASTASFATTDFPVLRLGDVYLMYAEAVLRGGTSGDRATALGYINALRDRANNVAGATDLRIADAQLTLPFILEERGREMFWEATRRTDLVRFGKLTDSTYLWQWKGGVKTGTGASSYLNVYPLPSSDLSANPNLKQNTGY